MKRTPNGYRTRALVADYKAGDKALLKTILDRAKQLRTADGPQLEREQQDLAFLIDMWPKTLRDSRAGSPAMRQGAGMRPAIPAQPCISVDKITPAIKQVIAQERASHMGITITAADDFAGLTGAHDQGKSEIELREGLVRRIQRHPTTVSARSWAFDRGIKAGRGFYRVLVEYVNERSFDREVRVERIWNQELCGLDPAHIEPSGRDAEWGFIFSWVPWDKYKREYKGTLASMSDWRDVLPAMSAAPDWMQDGEEPAVCVAEHFYFEDEDPKTLYDTDHGPKWKPEPGDKVLDEREVSQRVVKWCKVNGAEILKQQDWAGKFIPIIKVIGTELQPVKGERRYVGMVRPSKSSNEGFNFALSKAVQSVAFSPIPPYIATAEQVEGYQSWYEQAAVLPLPYVLYNGVRVDGALLPPPQRNVVEPPIQAATELSVQFNQLIQDTTSVHDSSLGKAAATAKSGIAIRSLQAQSEQATSTSLDNLARSEEYEGEIINDLLAPIYGARPGRLVEMVDGQLGPKTVMIGEPGQPAPQGASHPIYTLTDAGDFNIAIKISRSFDTRRDETNATLGEILSAHPDLFPGYADIFFASLDSPQSDQLEERAQILLPPQVQAAMAQKGQDPAAALQQMKAQSGKAQQLIDALTERVKQLHGIIENQTAKETAETSRQREALASKERIAEMQEFASLAATEAKINAQTAMQMIDGERERIMAKLEDLHSMVLSRQNHEQSLEAGQQAHQQQLEAGAVGHDQAMEQGAQPSPADPNDVPPSQDAGDGQ